MTLNNKKCDCFDTKYEGSASWHPTEHKEGCSFATPKNSEWEVKFDEQFGKVGPEMNSDSIGRMAGCDDCPTNIKLREEVKSFIRQFLQERSKEGFSSEAVALVFEKGKKIGKEELRNELRDLLGLSEQIEQK